jgi:L-lysine 2,3-aminomutase
MKDKICLLCKTAIDVEKEYCEFKHYEKRDKIRSKAYYHVNCFRERMMGNAEHKKIQKDARQIIDYAKKTLGIPEVVNI